MKKWVFGFDLSLTASACAALSLDWRPGDWKSVRTFLLKPKTIKDDDVAGQLSRYALTSNWAHDCIEKATSMPLGSGRAVAGCFIARPNAWAALQTIELGGFVRVRMWDETGVVPQTVSASQARALLLGPRAGGTVLRDALLNRGKAPKTWSEGLCSAFAVANFGLSESGGTALTLHRKDP
jgi:hypothetical protein